MIKLGYRPSIKKQKQPKGSFLGTKEFIYMVCLNKFDKLDLINKMEDFVILSKNINNPINPSENKLYQKFHNNYLIGKIRSIEKQEFNDYVYNLEVEDDHSYTANGNIVHNCAMTIVNMTQGWSHNSFKELIEDYNISNKNIIIERMMNEILEKDKSIGTDYNSFFNAANATKGGITPKSLL
jgi:hypothetical protein